MFSCLPLNMYINTQMLTYFHIITVLVVVVEVRV